jgi:hypothetical protein
MDQQPQADKIFNNIEIEPQAQSLLAPIFKWAKITAIFGLINIALMLVSTFTGGQGTGSPIGRIALGGSLLFIIPVAAVMALINLFLLRFSTATRQGTEGVNQQHFNQGIGFLRSYFKTIGIVIIVVIGLGLLGLLAFIIGFAFR